MTVKIRIPSSEANDSVKDVERPRSKPVARVVAGLLATALAATFGLSAVTTDREPEAELPAPFETASPEVDAAGGAGDLDQSTWDDRSLPGNGVVLAMGTIDDTQTAVTTDLGQPLVWQLIDETWQVVGDTVVDSVDSATVMDDRILFSGWIAGRPAVWEWVGGFEPYRFQPIDGSINGVWSIGGSLVVSVSASTQGGGDLVRPSDELWVESTDGVFGRVELNGLESVFAVAGDGMLVVGGSDSVGAAVGFLHDEQILSTTIPGSAEGSAVTDIEVTEDGRIFLLVSVPGATGEREGDVWTQSEAGLAPLTHDAGLMGFEVVGDVVIGVTPDGEVIGFDPDGALAVAPSTPSWARGAVLDVADLGDLPVLYGGMGGHPSIVGPGMASFDVQLPSDGWERYHSEESDGMRLLHVGSHEFASRDSELFYRSWNAERWRPVDVEGLHVYGRWQILELNWGLALIPGVGTGVWVSADGLTWDRVEGTGEVRIHEAVTDGETIVGITAVGLATGVTVIGQEGIVDRFNLPYRLVGPFWQDQAGFAASVVDPGWGYATSTDGFEWAREEPDHPFERIVGLDGGLYWSSGEAVDPDRPRADVPTGNGWLNSLEGGVVVWQTPSGSSWIRVGDRWEGIGLGVLDGLPAYPQSISVAGSKVFAMLETADGVAETYVFELD